jgi:TM2 domain-containing membrane protein YozV
MTVDIKRLTAHLSQSQQEEITKAYEKQAENETAVFLWCFFLGWMGAHRFYLRQWGQGIIHLILALITIGIAVGGALANLDPTLVVLAALPFGLAALLWEIIDLFRIDDEVSGRNLRLAEKLIADTMLADTSVLQQAQTKLDEVLHHVAAESGQSTEAELATTGLAAAAEPALAGAGESEPVVEAVADTGTTTEHYEATATTQASDDPGTDQKDNLPAPAGTHDWSETEAASVDELGSAEPSAVVEGIHIDETVTRAHTESGYTTTDSIDTLVSESAAEAEDTGDVVLAADMSPISTAESEAPTWPDLPPVALDAPVSEARSVDFTDMGEPVTATPVADVESVGATPLIVALGEEVTSPLRDSVTPSAPSAETAQEQPQTDVPVVGDTPVPATVDSYIPPIVPVVELSTADTQPVTTAPVEEEAPETLAELAGLAAATGAAGSTAPPAEAEAPPPAPEVAHAEEIEQASHLLKRIRVTRQIKVNGEVVEETSAEELVEADADPEPVRVRLRQQLHNQAAARMAELGITPDQDNS